jgi:hypothetical protein
MKIRYDKVLQNDHHDTKAARDNRDDHQLRATQFRRTTGRPAMNCQHNHRHCERNVGRRCRRRSEQAADNER